MYLTLAILLIAMAIGVLILAKGFKYPRNVWVLFICQPLWICISPIMTFIGGLLTKQIAPDPRLTTLPLTFLIVGVASSSFLVGYLAQRFGRKKATNIGFIIALLGALTAMFSALWGMFSLLLAAALLLGMSLAFSNQLRFAAIESVTSDKSANVMSALMLGGVFAAFVGPEVALLGKDWIVSEHEFAGSFLGMAGLIALAMLVFQLFENPISNTEQTCNKPSRPTTTIIKQPIFIISLASSAIAYGLMSLIMTATPLSMHEMDGHSLEATKWVIQSHIAAMFLPSLVTGILIKRLHTTRVLFLGTAILAGVLLISLSGQQIIHYWWALVLLGLGWNLLFITGTVLLPQSYRQSERFKIQSLNDFTIFTVQGLASLLSGWILFNSNWQTLIYSVMPVIVVMFGICVWHFYIKKTANNMLHKKVKNKGSIS